MMLLVRFRLRKLVRVADRIGKGQLGIKVPSMYGDLGPMAGALRRMAAELARAHTDATTDRLTGLANRQTFLSQFYAAIEHAIRYDRPIALLFADLDHFKDVNDTHGHDAGDGVLQQVAEIFRDNVRSADLVGRYGGEEFMIALPETGPDEAWGIAQKLRSLVEHTQFPIERDTLAMTVSIGVAGGSGSIVRAETLIQHADAAMYSAKAMGRNRCVVFKESEDELVRRAPIGSAERATAYEAGELGRSAAEDALLALIMPREHFAGRPSPIIASVAVRMAQVMGLGAAEVERIRMASLLHDIGKLGIPDEILFKREPLTPDEWHLVREHPRIGELIVEEAGKVSETGSIILHHHERFAGAGYPHGLRGIEIPIGARILAVADAYDAMVLDRPYRDSIDHRAAVDELRRWSGTQFDPELVDLFCDLYSERPPKVDVRLVRSTNTRRAKAAS